MGLNVGKGWRGESVRHSNARKYGSAGGTYSKGSMNLKNNPQTKNSKMEFNPHSSEWKKVVMNVPDKYREGHYEDRFYDVKDKLVGVIEHKGVRKSSFTYTNPNPKGSYRDLGNRTIIESGEETLFNYIRKKQAKNIVYNVQTASGRYDKTFENKLEAELYAEKLSKKYPDTLVELSSTFDIVDKEGTPKRATTVTLANYNFTDKSKSKSRFDVAREERRKGIIK